MALTSEQREQIVQIRKFAADLNLSNDQKEKLRTLRDRAMQKAQTYRTVNPNAPNADLRAVTFNPDQIRQQIVNFLTPEHWAASVPTLSYQPHCPGAKRDRFTGARLISEWDELVLP